MLLLLHAQNALKVPGYLNGAVILVVLVSAGLIGIARLELAKTVKPEPAAAAAPEPAPETHEP